MFLIQLRRGVLDTTLRDKVFQWLAAGGWFSAGTPVSSNNKTDHHDITEVLLKVTLNTITPLTHKFIPNVRYLIFFTVYNSKPKINYMYTLSDIYWHEIHITWWVFKKWVMRTTLYFFVLIVPFFCHLIDNIKYLAWCPVHFRKHHFQHFETGFVTCSKKTGTILHFIWVKSKIEWYQMLTKRITFYHVILKSDLFCPIIHVHVSNYFSCNIWFYFTVPVLVGGLFMGYAI